MFEIIAKNAKKHLVFGYANIITKADGEQVVDSDGDVIELDELEDATVEFMKHHRSSGVMHDGEATGVVIENMVVSPEKIEAMGFSKAAQDEAPEGLWLGVQLHPDVYQRVESGELTMFSIEGHARREEV